MNDMRVPILGVYISPTTYENVLRRITSAIQNRKREYVCVAATHLIVECQDDPKLRAGVNGATLVVPDGMPLVWLLRRRGHPTERIYGPDLMLKICSRAATERWCVFLYAGASDKTTLLAKKLIARFPKLRIAETIDAADIVFVGLGCPLQERWMIQNRKTLRPPVLIGVGAAFDFVSGTKQQAPRFVQRIGLEWLFRLIQEPRRLWKRYLIGNILFLWKLLNNPFRLFGK